MTMAGSTLLEAALAVWFALVVGVVLYKIATVRGPASKASDYGRKWLAWLVLIASATLLPKFFLGFDVDSVALWLIGLAVYGPIAFGAGWLYGKVLGEGQTAAKSSREKLPMTHDRNHKEQVKLDYRGPTNPSEYDQLASKVEANVTRTVKKGTAVASGTFRGLMSPLPKWLKIVLVIIGIYVVSLVIGSMTGPQYTY